MLMRGFWEVHRKKNMEMGYMAFWISKGAAFLALRGGLFSFDRYVFNYCESLMSSHYIFTACVHYHVSC